MSTVDEEGGQVQGAEVGDDVEVTQAMPDRLLNLCGYPKLGEFPGGLRVGEIRSDAKFELALAPGIGIAVTKAGIGQVLAEFPYRFTALTARELVLERLAVWS